MTGLFEGQSPASVCNHSARWEELFGLQQAQLQHRSRMMRLEEVLTTLSQRTSATVPPLHIWSCLPRHNARNEKEMRAVDNERGNFMIVSNLPCYVGPK
jgi:hypothetical protein